MTQFKILPDEKLYDLFHAIPKVKQGKFVPYSVGLQNIAKAEQKHTIGQFIEWGNETCPDCSMEGAAELRKDCDGCWAELEKEVEK